MSNLIKAFAEIVSEAELSKDNKVIISVHDARELITLFITRNDEINRISSGINAAGYSVDEAVANFTLWMAELDRVKTENNTLMADNRRHMQRITALESGSRPIPAQQSPSAHDDQGFAVIEQALKRVSSGNLAEAPFPLAGDEAKCWLNGAASAYQHALEMIVPQQSPAIEVTPEMLRAAQLNTEIGKYICSNWAGAYDCLTELFNAMLAAASKQSPAVVVPDHWSIKNPGIADQFKNEATACRLALGFNADADDVAPVDLIEKIESLKASPDVGDFEVFLVEYHSQVWAAASDEDGKTSYDDAGKELAKSFIASIKQSPRITEQEFREIFIQLGFPEMMFGDWMKNRGGRILLNKLNKVNHETN